MICIFAKLHQIGTLLLLSSVLQYNEFNEQGRSPNPFHQSEYDYTDTSTEYLDEEKRSPGGPDGSEELPIDHRSYVLVLTAVGLIFYKGYNRKLRHN